MHFDQFLKEVTPELGLQWRPFQRRGIKRKVERRIIELGLPNLDQYLLKVQKDPEEKSHLSKILTVTISRFFRDGDVFDALEASVLPDLIRNKMDGRINLWSIGCASGEEPYSLALLWKNSFERDWPQVRFSVLGTDIDERMLQRAKDGRYKKSSLREVPEEILKKFFKKEGSFFILDPSVQKNVQFKIHDILRDNPFSGMDIILCRNLAFTYFSKESQMEVVKRIGFILNEKGYMVIGKEESLFPTFPTLFISLFPAQKIYQKFAPAL